MVVAPMPGIILSIAVKEGDQVNAGDAILVLEAMKMENEIHAPRSGIVKTIHVSEGSEVRAGSELIEIE
jgi:pyruvate carboxylase subunit B